MGVEKMTYPTDTTILKRKIVELELEVASLKVRATDSETEINKLKVQSVDRGTTT